MKLVQFMFVSGHDFSRAAEALYLSSAIEESGVTAAEPKLTGYRWSCTQHDWP